MPTRVDGPGPVADYLSKQADGFAVETFHGLCLQIAGSAGLEVCVPEDKDAAATFWSTEAPELLMRGLDACPDERFDAVVVDEGLAIGDALAIATRRTP